MKRILLTIATFFMLCILFGGAFLLSSPPVSREPIPVEIPPEPGFTLWYPDSHSLSEFVLDYAARWQQSIDCRIELSAYSSEAELEQMLSVSRPDLLICSGGLSLSFGSSGLLSSAGSSIIDYCPAFRSCSPAIGDLFFPIGGSIDVLAVNTALCSVLPGYTGPDGFESFEALLAFASEAGRGGSVLFSADSFANLFLSCLDGLTGGLSAVKEEDALNEAYVEFYNLLAEDFMEGGIGIYDTDCCELLQLEKLPAAIISSAEAGLLPEDFDIYPLPPYAGGRTSSGAELTGFAVTCENPDNIPVVSGFLTSFFTDPDYSDTVLALGFLPGIFDASKLPDTPLAGVLAGIAANGRLIVPEINNDYNINRAEFEARFRRQIVLLYN